MTLEELLQQRYKPIWIELEYAEGKVQAAQQMMSEDVLDLYFERPRKDYDIPATVFTERLITKAEARP